MALPCRGRAILLLVVLAVLGALECRSDEVQQPVPHSGEQQQQQHAHYTNGQHNPNFVVHDWESTESDNAVLDRMETVDEMMEFLWNGGSFHGSDIWQKPKPLYLVDDTPSRRVGFLLQFANSIAVETSDGLVVIDTGSFMTSNAIQQQLSAWSPSLPLHTAIWTHGHQDHVWGIDRWEAYNRDLLAGQRRQQHRGDHDMVDETTDTAQASDPDIGLSDSADEKQKLGKVRVVAHRAVLGRFARYRATRGYNTQINARQFEGEPEGIDIPADFRSPDLLYEHELTLTVGSETLHLFHDRGETDDATWVWLPRSRVLATGDFFIWYAPNAGNPQKVQRYAGEWSAALRKMAALKPRALLPGHGVPIVGEERVQQALLNTADYLEIIFNRTIELMNAGKDLDYIIHHVSVPAHLSALPYLRPHYDETEFIVRNIWRLYGGWWDLNPAHLKPAPRQALGQELALLAGGVDQLAARALELAAEHTQQSLALACHLIEFAADAEPNDKRVLDIHRQVYMARANHPLTTSSMARNLFIAASKARLHHLNQATKVAIDNSQATASADSSWFSRLISKIRAWLTGEDATSMLATRTVPISELDFSLLQPVTEPIPAKFEALVAEKKAMLFEILNEPLSDWELFSDEVGVKAWARTRASDGRILIRSAGTIPRTTKQVMALLLDPNHRTKLDSRTKLDQIVAPYTRSFGIRRQLYPQRMMVAARELIAFEHWSAMEATDMPSSFFFVTASVPCPEGVLLEPGAIEMDLEVGGFLLTPSRYDPEFSDMVMVYSLDIKGSLPASSSRLVGAAQARVINKIAACLVD